MDKALKAKEKADAAQKEVDEINQRNFQAMIEQCRVNIGKKGEQMDFMSRLHRERNEAILEEKLLRAQEAAEILPKEVEERQIRAEELVRLRNDEIRALKHRQVIRDQNIELKELESQLKSSYAAKSAQVQLREREAIRADEKYREYQTSVMRSRWYNDDAFDQHLAAVERDKNMRYRNALQDQLVVNETMRRQRTEEWHRERKIVEQISEVLRNEDVDTASEKKEKTARIQAEREAFFRAMKTWKSKEREALLDEFSRQAKIIAKKEAEEKNRAVVKAGKSDVREEIMERAARRMLDDETRRNEKEDIVNELFDEEWNSKVAMELKDAAARKEAVKRELLADMERQKVLVSESRAKSLAVDAAFGKYLVEQSEAADKKESEKSDERRRRGLQYGRDLKTVRDEQRALHAEEVLLTQAIQRQDDQREVERLKEVSLERSKILYEHAPNLKGFLKAGTLRTEDLEYMKMQQCSSN
ncbi:meiosis-specific nuclear structural protein 1-like [Neodiprion lecontei]|uniref:Meiosis-specific nuclear structural protein 1 n=1 Tax=Neodiprion lecontei TaxID=441921 RepID=A0A6J0C600_NEOLC|nr:meiosis-specific nuclear structural protein 1-like [Neodiprion lecontei]